ncbi:MAG: N-acetyltransferase [Prolixibacteraceae bacterium]|nr:N-acetyltransferase [Burkholderiales bacterium]
MLINQMYGWRGYGSGFTVEDRAGQITLVARDYATTSTFGTITVALDGENGLLADKLYHEEIECLRVEGRRLCEMIKFAVDKSIRSKHLLSALFHVAFIYAYHLQKRTDLLIEVTPQHAVFYRHLLHFKPAGPEKLNPRVNTRGVLLRLNLDHAAEQIRLLGGQGESSKDRSLYPYAFSSKEEAGIIERLRNLEPGN